MENKSIVTHTDIYDVTEKFVLGGLVGWAFELVVYDKPKGVSYFRPIYALGSVFAQPGCKGLLFNCLAVACLEGVAGVLYNQDHHLWDYTDEPFNWRGHFCLKSVLGLGLAMTVYASMPRTIRRTVCCVLIAMGLFKFLSEEATN